MTEKCVTCGHETEHENESDDVLAVLVIDESGSMHSLKEDTIGGVNEFIHKQKKLSGKASLLINTFSSGLRERVRTIVEDVPVKDVKPFTQEDYRPSGNTPLLDAFGETIAQVEKIADGRRVIITVFTDGYENSSVKYKVEDLKDLIESKDWQFMFIGAGIDAWGTGIDIGGAYLASNSISAPVTGQGVRHAFNVANAATQVYRGDSTLRSVEGFASTAKGALNTDDSSVEVDTTSNTTNKT